MSEPQRVLVTGGTGTLGRAVVRALVHSGVQPVVFSRREPDPAALIHVVAGLAVAPTGLMLEAPAYIALWSAWAVGGIIAWVTRRKPHAAFALAGVDVTIWMVGVFLLPRLSGGGP